MATITQLLPMTASSVALFKQWAMSFNNAFTTFGWVQTADTGQVNWSSITTSVPGGFLYEIFKANDSLASSMPIFVKLEYWNNPGIRVTFGSGSDGAGNITGACSQSPWISMATDWGTPTYPCYFSGSAGEFRCSMWTANNQNMGWTFCIERSKDTTGANTSEYVTFFGYSDYSGAVRQQSIYSGGTLSNLQAGIMTVAPTNQSGTGFSNGTTAAYPVFPDVGKCGNPIIGYMTAYAADIPFNTQVTVSGVYGASHNYISIKGVNQGGNFLANALGQRNTNPVYTALLMRYE